MDVFGRRIDQEEDGSRRGKGHVSDGEMPDVGNRA